MISSTTHAPPPMDNLKTPRHTTNTHVLPRPLRSIRQRPGEIPHLLQGHLWVEGEEALRLRRGEDMCPRHGQGAARARAAPRVTRHAPRGKLDPPRPTRRRLGREGEEARSQGTGAAQGHHGRRQPHRLLQGPRRPHGRDNGEGLRETCLNTSQLNN